MAITINIFYTGVGSAARDFASDMIAHGVVDQIRAEAGNLRYDYFIPLDDSQTVLLIDS